MRCKLDIEGARFSPLAPFGGMEQAGLGRELGRHSLEEFLSLTSLQA
jgi:acyl-CoA reductase-like NAD-dependent aldehyde dehydrogenase